MTIKPTYLMARDIHALVPHLAQRAQRIVRDRKTASLLVQRTVQEALVSLPEAETIEAALTQVMDALVPPGVKSKRKLTARIAEALVLGTSMTQTQSRSRPQAVRPNLAQAELFAKDHAVEEQQFVTQADRS
jgi:hypothetical protein